MADSLQTAFKTVVPKLQLVLERNSAVLNHGLCWMLLDWGFAQQSLRITSLFERGGEACGRWIEQPDSRLESEEG